MPEVGLLFHGADGTFGPSLLTLKMDKKTRRLVEPNIQSGLGVGSRENRTISQEHRGYLNRSNWQQVSWFLQAGLLRWAIRIFKKIFHGVFSLGCPSFTPWQQFPSRWQEQQQRASKQGPMTLLVWKTRPAHPTGSPIGKRLFEVLIQTGDLISSHYKVVCDSDKPEHFGTGCGNVWVENHSWKPFWRPPWRRWRRWGRGGCMTYIHTQETSKSQYCSWYVNDCPKTYEIRMQLLSTGIKS